MSDMEVCRPYTERYLLTLTFYAADCPYLNWSGVVKRPRRIPTHSVRVRVTNTDNRPLTGQNLQCVTLSLPDLYYRLTGNVYAPGLLHLADLQTELLPPGYHPPAKPTAHEDSSSRGETRSRRFSLGNSSTPPTRGPVAEEHQQEEGGKGEGESCTPDWLLCDGSFVPDHPGKEWTVINYRGQEFNRAFSRVIWTENAADILGRCNITDYTVYEQFVFSADVDILHDGRSDRKELISTTRELRYTPGEERMRNRPAREPRSHRYSRRRHSLPS